MIPDPTLRHLRAVADLPDLTGTRYELLEPIGRGGMGTVYRVRDRELGRDVALKVLNGPAPAAARGLDRLRAEARILARLEHPGIVPVHDVGVLEDGRPFYVMKLVRGERLDEHVRRLTGVPDRIRVLQRIVEAVALAHAHGIVHRDLTPANVMVGPFGEVLVMDWGVARVMEAAAAAGSSAVPESAGSDAASHAGGTADGTVIGTPGFMAPEQARGDVGAVDERSDVYALGALLGWLLDPATGAPPSPRSLAAVRARACAERPEDRYPSAAAFGEELARYLDGLPVSAHRESPAERIARFARTYRVAILLVVGYLVMRIALILFAGV